MSLLNARPDVLGRVKNLQLITLINYSFILDRFVGIVMACALLIRLFNDMKLLN